MFGNIPVPNVHLFQTKSRYSLTSEKPNGNVNGIIHNRIMFKLTEYRKEQVSSVSVRLIFPIGVIRAKPDTVVRRG